jgi:hypothetical protein
VVVDDDARTRSHIAHAVADLDHDAAGLVTHDHSGHLTGCGRQAEVVQVGAAQARRSHLDHDLAGSGLGMGKRRDDHPTVAEEAHASHARGHPSSSR